MSRALILGALGGAALALGVVAVLPPPAYDLVMVDEAGEAYVIDSQLTASDCIDAQARTVTAERIVCEASK